MKEMTSSSFELWLRTTTEQAGHTPGYHIAIFTEPFLSHLLAGRKTIESRFSDRQIAPYKRVYRGDVIAVKKSSGPVLAHFIAGSTTWEDMCHPLAVGIPEVIHSMAPQLCADQTFLETALKKRYVTLITVTALTIYTEPIKIGRRGMAGWLCL